PKDDQETLQQSQTTKESPEGLPLHVGQHEEGKRRQVKELQEHCHDSIEEGGNMKYSII
ncbi:Hypothetical protein FKW44_008154, partial [Caligus rogercresseyi]